MSSNPDWLIVGLGNPGKRYESNRHNIGWMVVSALAEKYKVEFVARRNIYLQADIYIKSKSVAAIMPTTFMNNSGEAVLKTSRSLDIPVDRILIICDEYNFPLGKIHLKIGGSDGGHNGIESIINELDTDKFYRLRCGIGRNFPQGRMVDYVLSDFSEDELEQRNMMIKKAVGSIECLVVLGPASAMSLINSGKLWED